MDREWSVDYYKGAEDGTKNDVQRLKVLSQQLTDLARVLGGRRQQFLMAVNRIATLEAERDQLAAKRDDLDLRDKEAFRQAFRAGAAWATGSHQDFEQTHPDFDAWWASREEE
jgi:hypothetical protein